MQLLRMKEINLYVLIQKDVQSVSSLSEKGKL